MQTLFGLQRTASEENDLLVSREIIIPPAVHPGILTPNTPSHSIYTALAETTTQPLAPCPLAPLAPLKVGEREFTNEYLSALVC